MAMIHLPGRLVRAFDHVIKNGEDAGHAAHRSGL